MRQAQNLILELSGRPTHRSRRPHHSPPARNHPRQSPIALTATTFAPLTCWTAKPFNSGRQQAVKIVGRRPARKESDARTPLNRHHFCPLTHFNRAAVLILLYNFFFSCIIFTIQHPHTAALNKEPFARGCAEKA